MKTCLILLLVAAAVCSFDTSAHAQPAGKVARIGLLQFGQVEGVAFLRQLKQMGYSEGRNISLEYRWADGQHDLLPTLAADLVRLRVDVIVANGPTAIAPAIKATIPIVMVSGGNPVSRGFVQSLSRPGGNVTGLSSDNAGVSGKRLELLKETLPFITRVALLNPEHRRPDRIGEYNRVAAKLGISIHSFAVETSRDLEPAFVKIAMMHPDALVTVRHNLTVNHSEAIAEFAISHRLPSMHGAEEFVRAGGLMSYGLDYTASWKRAAVFVDKILKGANPGTLPVEPSPLKFAVNLNTAKRIGVAIPPEILLEANEVIR
jgi:putative tryptophan/tyrosine transport system substrate-binding protein